MKRPWMPIYIADYLRKTTHLGALESGAYLHLIMDYWQNDGLPADERQLARIAKLTDREWKACRATLQAFFHDGWKHERIDDEIKEAVQLAESKAVKARGAANKRWSKHREDKPEAMLQACSEHAPSNATNDAPRCTLHTSQRKEEAAGAATPLRYAFESGVIKLNQKDFDQWTKAFVHLNLPAKLLALTEWAGKQRSWFNAVASALAKADAAAKLEMERAAPAPFKWNGIEGVV